MPQKYSPEEIWKLIDKLPKELEDAFFSAETAKNIGEICKRNGVQNSTSKIAEQIGYALVGLLPPEEFKEFLLKELGAETGKRVMHEVNRFIFFPVKHELAELYRQPTEAAPGQPAAALPEKAPSETEASEKKSSPKTSADDDLYREEL